MAQCLCFSTRDFALKRLQMIMQKVSEDTCFVICQNQFHGSLLHFSIWARPAKIAWKRSGGYFAPDGSGRGIDAWFFRPRDCILRTLGTARIEPSIPACGRMRNSDCGLLFVLSRVGFRRA